MLENIDWEIIIQTLGILIPILVGGTVYKLVQRNKLKINNSNNIEIGANSSNNSISQTSSHNINLCNINKEDGE